VLVGCIVGCTPLFGFHILLCIALSFALGLNKLVVYGAANLSIPPLVPFIGFASVQLGERTLHGRWLSLARADFPARSGAQLARLFFVDWMVGGAILGSAIGLVAGGVTFAILRARRRAALAAGPIAVDGDGASPIATQLQLSGRRRRQIDGGDANRRRRPISVAIGARAAATTACTRASSGTRA
jgi:hypothetical protein